MRLKLNAKKTEVITYNILPDHSALTTTGGTVLKEVNDFKYLGAWMNSTEQDLQVRKTLIWKALNSMASVWKSNLPQHIKITFFHSLYGCECCTLKSTLQKYLNGCYTRLLRAVLNIKQDEHTSNKCLYGG